MLSSLYREFGLCGFTRQYAQAELGELTTADCGKTFGGQTKGFQLPAVPHWAQSQVRSPPDWYFLNSAVNSCFCQFLADSIMGNSGKKVWHDPSFKTNGVTFRGIFPKNYFTVLFPHSFDWDSHSDQSRVSATSCYQQGKLSFENTSDVMSLHNCLSVLGVFNKCLFRLILTVYFCFTAAFDLTAAGNSAAGLFICCTPAVFPKVPLP